MNNNVYLTDIIAPAFYDVHNDIIDGKHTYYDLYGGRGSTKSSFISVEIVLGTPEECQEARRKQEPKKYKLINSVRCCPECDSPIKVCYYFCKTCGQAIDWSGK